MKVVCIKKNVNSSKNHHKVLLTRCALVGGRTRPGFQKAFLAPFSRY